MAGVATEAEARMDRLGAPGEMAEVPQSTPQARTGEMGAEAESKFRKLIVS